MSFKKHQSDTELLFCVSEKDYGARLDAYLAEASPIDASDSFCGDDNSYIPSRSAAAKLCDDGRVTVNGKSEPKKYKVKPGDAITVSLPDPMPLDAIPEPIPLDIIYEDADLIVINKPVGMVVHPAPGNYSGTLVNALLYHCGNSLSGIGGTIRPGIVHRIDKDTSGLLVVAKNDLSHNVLAEAIKRHDVRRTYVALLCGTLGSPNGTVDMPIGRHPTDRKKMAVIKNGVLPSRPAVTHWQTCEYYRGASMVVCKLETGRTHQIRVHMSFMGHPILGDPIYGGECGEAYEANRKLIIGQCLHAARLEFLHPRTSKPMSFTAPCPPNMAELIARLRSSADYREPFTSINDYTKDPN